MVLQFLLFSKEVSLADSWVCMGSFVLRPGNDVCEGVRMWFPLLSRVVTATLLLFRFSFYMADALRLAS